ncbi:TPA: hypothetical protein UON56_000449 [Stenotrophomonas maltophilia]|uniref:hypothetical protein n=1 Tax=Stenotrophomonas maltophilia TaxID=40324 RepID=UPI0013DC39B7|nr:hypothetical protein [Stenotrophomonas maltophilia]MBH1412610.1 hypothetical protein [Stenotrophomonas maltophilia]MBH1421951.1 hypothetical protein [Stenotrophomonas maltophilia]MBN5111804.1 hypothetical protein [Stenotrophomonas maltophilia]HEL4775918.1 hypothetical protein [Stenotrophomonas maltophilia]HEL5311617.1 hypothetical protein [Stenotrophomonas maltophilia]
MEVAEVNEHEKDLQNTEGKNEAGPEVTVPVADESDVGNRSKSAGSTWWLWWPEVTRDGWRLLIALVVIVIAAVAGRVPVPGNVDPYARVNLIVLGLVVASWIVGLCSSVSQRAWASVFGVAGLVLWFVGIYFSSTGVVKALLDMVTFW